MESEESGSAGGRGTWRGTRRKSAFSQIKPEGGFCFVPAMGLIASWWAYKRGIVSLADLRVWLAIFEVLARRCGVRVNRSFVGVEHELATLVGASADSVATCLRRLERSGFLRRTRTTFRPILDLSQLQPEERENLLELTARVRNHRRKVPVPRRLLRMLGRTTRPVLWATTVGHLLRCMYYRDGQCAPDGRCKATWIADVFEVDSRNVKAARRELVQLGVLFVDPTDQCSMNRWGPRARFNLSWRGPAGGPTRPPPPAALARRIPPPRKNRELASRSGDQEPACTQPLGHPPARSWHVARSDLQLPQELQRLFERSVELRLCTGSEAARLAYFATAARALRVSTSNAPGLFATLVRRRRWDYATLADEDQARRWIQRLAAPRDIRPRPPALRPREPDRNAPAHRAPETAACVMQRLLPRLFPTIVRPPAARPQAQALTHSGPPRA
ncbi:MAG: hypothetical protein IT450_01435 [Phycisphaerales bacterium]|nr:hypothetical protein [Phycisphaerales bacterium]